MEDTARGSTHVGDLQRISCARDLGSADEDNFFRLKTIRNQINSRTPAINLGDTLELTVVVLNVEVQVTLMNPGQTVPTLMAQKML